MSRKSFFFNFPEKNNEITKIWNIADILINNSCKYLRSSRRHTDMAISTYGVANAETASGMINESIKIFMLCIYKDLNRQFI